MDDGIPDGPFTESHPSHRFCGSKENHPEHKDRELVKSYRGTEGWWYRCPGWETTHTITVTDTAGRVIGAREVDLRGSLKYNGSTNDPVLTLLHEAHEAKLPRPSDDELLFAIAGYTIAPEICPWDSDRCHEHLYEFAGELEDEE